MKCLCQIERRRNDRFFVCFKKSSLNFNALPDLLQERERQLVNQLLRLLLLIMQKRIEGTGKVVQYWLAHFALTHKQQKTFAIFHFSLIIFHCRSVSANSRVQ